MKKIMILALMCLMTISGKAQVFSYDQAGILPSVDLYDDEMMEMALRAIFLQGICLRVAGLLQECEEGL